MGELRQNSLSIGLVNWLSCISAIVDRDITTRYAGGVLGHAWAIIIPVSWVLAITVFFRFIGRTAPIYVDLPTFLATGMFPYLMFRQSITSMSRSIRSNRHLITLGPTKPEDIFTATAVLECINAILISVVILIGISLWSGFPQISDPLIALSGLALTLGFGVALGRLAAVAARLSDSAMRLIPIILRPFFWISGIFFIAAEVPDWILSWLWFNPLLHTIELLRVGFFPGFTSQFCNPLVPVFATILVYLASRLLEAHINSQKGQGFIST